MSYSWTVLNTGGAVTGKVLTRVDGCHEIWRLYGVEWSILLKLNSP